MYNLRLVPTLEETRPKLAGGQLRNQRPPVETRNMGNQAKMPLPPAFASNGHSRAFHSGLTNLLFAVKSPLKYYNTKIANLIARETRWHDIYNSVAIRWLGGWTRRWASGGWTCPDRPSFLLPKYNAWNSTQSGGVGCVNFCRVLPALAPLCGAAPQMRLGLFGPHRALVKPHDLSSLPALNFQLLHPHFFSSPICTLLSTTSRYHVTSFRRGFSLSHF